MRSGVAYHHAIPHGLAMILRAFLVGLLAAFVLPAAAGAACYADYKAKQDDPLQLHYGVVRLSDAACADPARAAAEIAERIRRDGWQLLNVVSTFDEAGLSERKTSAGAYFLRY